MNKASCELKYKDGLKIAIGWVLLVTMTNIFADGAILIQDRNSRATGDPPDVERYLTDFGYLSKANLETGAMRSREELNQAVRNLQKMAGLPQTGDENDPQLKEILKKDRCGIGDNRVEKDPNAPQNYHITDLKWPKNKLTFKIMNYSPDYNSEAQRADIHRAFDIWHKSANLNFTEVASNQPADIVISFDTYHHQDGYPFDGKSGVLAHAFPPGDDRGGDAHFDDSEVWTNDGDGTKTDLFIVAAHEFGHSLGIFHSEKRGALMYPWYQGYTPNLRLDYDDIIAIQTLYGPPPRNLDDPTRTDRPIVSLPTTTTRRPTPSPRPIPTTKPGSDESPNPCNANLDAISIVRGETFAFSGKWFWRFDQSGSLMERDGAFKTSQFWDAIPKDLERIDALTFLKYPDISLFFSGDRYWILKARDLTWGTPREGFKLTQLGLPTWLTSVDAALTWGFNGKTYIFSGHNYWRLDSTGFSRNVLKVEDEHPKTFDMWGGIPVPVDAAFTNNQNETFFFKGTQFWKMDDAKMKPHDNYPQDIGKMWLKCPSEYRAYNSKGHSYYQTTLGSLLTVIGSLYLAFF